MDQIQEFARRGKITIVVDENLSQLSTSLKLFGFKIINVTRGMSDEDVSELASNFILATKNTRDFYTSAIVHDFDIIDLSNMNFIDDAQDKNNKTSKIVSDAIRSKSFPPKTKGNFMLSVFSDGKSEVKEIY